MLVLTRSIDIMHSRILYIQICKIVIVVVLLSPDSDRRYIFDDQHAFHCNEYVALGQIRSCFGVFSGPIFLWISSNSCPLTLLLFEAEIIIVKRLIQGRRNVTRVEVESRSCDQYHRKNDAFILSATLPT